MKIKIKDPGAKNTLMNFSNGENKLFTAILVWMLICTGWFMIIFTINNMIQASPVITFNENEGSWNDTFNDTTGIYDMNGVIVDMARDNVTLKLEGYLNNFDNEPVGPMPNWTYEVLSNSMQHNVINDPYESGRCLFLARNDNLASYDEHKLWIEFDIYYEIVDFDLTPWSIEGTNRQAYFYIEFYNGTNDVIHEVRYYWDDNRSGVPAKSSTLTAIDLNWDLPMGAPGVPGDVRFFLHENISEDIGANSLATLVTILLDTMRVRYGFYQDAGPEWVQVDQVHIDNMAIHTSGNRGDLISVIIAPPDLGRWDYLNIFKTEMEAIDSIAVSVLDAVTNLPIDGFVDLTDTNVDLSSIDAAKYRAIRLQANFYGEGPTPILHSWEINWKINNLPTVESINNSAKSVLRTQSITISAIGFDIETLQSELLPTFQYKSLFHSSWQTKYLSSLKYESDRWNITFTPPAKSALGYYDFRVRFTDSFGGVGNWNYLNNTTLVLNNKPMAPFIEIIPQSPFTLDNLVASIIVRSEDVEKEPISYTYNWYKNDLIQDSLTQNHSTSLINAISHINTEKNDVWKCIVIPNDGYDDGQGGSDERTIRNSPPNLRKEFNTFIMFEDTPVILENKLVEIFSDIDMDELRFYAVGENNITVKITQENGTVELIPRENWFGTEYITFYANDSSPISAQQTVQITVNPINDLPRITKIGNQYTVENYPELEFIVNQKDSLNLKIHVEDIDGDVQRGMIEYILNITERNNFYFQDYAASLIFHPRNQDVGWYYINISITDNNETPRKYICQHIKILVKNINDPPKVKIISPEDGKEFLMTNNISFTCIAEDADLLVWNSMEELTFKWYTNITKIGYLGTKQNLTNISLPPGFYNITVEVNDIAGAKTFDHLHLRIKETQEIKNETIKTNSEYFWFNLFVIIIIIIILILLLIVFQKRKKRLETMGLAKEPVLQPDVEYYPLGLGATPNIEVNSKLSQPLVIKTESFSGRPPQKQLTPPQPSALITRPTAQLPPVRLTVQEEYSVATQQAGIDVRLSPQEKLALLEERLVKGEIDQYVYINLKDKFEMEVKPYQSLPQLPPVNGPETSTSTLESTKIPIIQPTTVETPSIAPTPSIVQPVQPESEHIPEVTLPPEVTPPEIVEPSLEHPPVNEAPEETPSPALTFPVEQTIQQETISPISKKILPKVEGPSSERQSFDEIPMETIEESSQIKPSVKTFQKTPYQKQQPQTQKQFPSIQDQTPKSKNQMENRKKNQLKRNNKV